MPIVATERLCLDSSRTRIIREGEPGAAFILANKGCVIPAKYEHLLAGGRKPESQPQDTEDAGPMEDRETRIVTGLRRRGRPRKSDAE